MAKGISRRSFLKVSSVGIGSSVMGGLLAACVAPPASGPASGPAATSAPSGAAGTTGTTEAPAAGSGSGKIVFSSYTWSGYEMAMQQVIDLWKAENPNTEVEGQFIAEDYDTKVQTQVAAGTPPDVGIAAYQKTVRWAKEGVILPLDDYINRDSYPMSDFLPSAVDNYRWREGDFVVGGQGGKVYGLPSDAQGYLFAYNKNLFDEAKVSYPTDDWTWDDLLTAAKAITKPDEDKWGIYAPSTYALNAGNFTRAAGATIATPDFTKSTLDAPETVAVYKWVWDLIYTHKVAPHPQPQEPANPFVSGRVGMYTEGIWWVADFKAITEFGWDLAMMPKHPTTGKRTTSLESDGWWVFKGTKDPEAAWSLTKFLANANGQKKFSELEYVVPSCIPSVASEWYSRKPPESRGKAFENIQQDSYLTNNMFYDFYAIWGAVSPVLDKAFFDGENIETQMQEAAQVMNEELGKSWQKFKE